MRGSNRPPIFPSCVLWFVISTTDLRIISSGLKIPNAGATALDDVFDSQNKRHVEVNNERRTKCDEGSVNKEKSDLRWFHAEFLSQPGAYSKCLLFKIVGNSGNHFYPNWFAAKLFKIRFSAREFLLRFLIFLYLSRSKFRNDKRFFSTTQGHQWAG